MINNILEFVLLNGVEGALFLLMCVGFDVKSLAKGKLFWSWFILTCIIYFVPIVLMGIPLLTQFTSLFLSAILMSVMFKFDLKLMCKRLFILLFLIMLPSEAIWYLIVNKIVNMDIYITLDTLSKFKLGIGGRIMELILTYLYFKGAFYMKMWFLGNTKKDSEVKKETEKK